MIKAIIFDMEGVIVETQKCDLLSWQQIFSVKGVKLSANDYKKFLGQKGIEIFKNLIKVGNKEAKILQNKRRFYFKECVKKYGLKTTKGLVDFLEKLLANNYKIALGTASSKKRMNFILKYVNLKKYFKVTICGDDVSKGKPDPETFLKIANKIRVRPEECIVIEDALNGVQAAHKAGMKCIAITTTHAKQKLKDADKIIDSFYEFSLEDLRNL